MAGPVDIALARKHLGVDGADQDDLIGAYLLAAQDAVEDMTGMLLEADDAKVQQFDGFGFTGALCLRAWPVRGIVSVKYLDPANVEQSVAPANWRLVRGRPGKVAPLPAFYWPTPLAGPGTVAITFQAGFESADDVPEAIKVAMLMLLGHFWSNRSAVEAGATAAAIELPIGVEMLLRPHRMVSI